MSSVRVTHGIDMLAADARRIAVTTKPKMARVMKKNVTEGNKVAQRFAKAASGPHGKSYWKRLSGEMTGPLQGEYGPHDGGTPVGGGWRNGPPNTDLPKSADVIGPKFAKDAGDILDGLFW